MLLKPDGLFIGAMMGGETLRELRIAMQLAEEEARDGVSPHVSPMVQLRDAGSVLGRAGLRLTTVDVDEIKVPFRDMRAVMRHVKGMGDSNAVAARRPHYGRRVFARAEQIYSDMFGYVDDRGRPCVPATFQLVHLIGWSPADASVQRAPAARGSANASLADLSDMVAGDGASRRGPGTA
jgi:NADH dehydrogenase [ubiquinone] 1 alpha subcomplex assembly factor 5